VTVAADRIEIRLCRTKVTAALGRRHIDRGEVTTCRQGEAPRHREWRRAEVNAGLAAMIGEAFAIRSQLLSGSDDSIEAMAE
jgi:hypothetical protein